MKKLWFSNLALVLGCLNTTAAFGQYPGAYGSLAPSAFPVQNQQAQMSMHGFSQVPQGSYPTGAMPGAVQPNGMPNQAYSMQGYSQPTAQPQPTTAFTQPGWLTQRNVPVQLTSAQEGAFGVPGQPMPSVGNLPVPMQGPGQPSVAAGMPQSIVESVSPMQQQMNPSVQNQGQVQNYQPTPNQSQMGMSPVYAQSIAPGCTSCGSAPVSESYGYPMYAQSYGSQYGMSHFGSRIGNFGQGCCSLALPYGAKPYFGGASALLFHRVDDRNVALSYDANDPSGANALGTRDARYGTMPGFEVFLGRYFNCGRNALTIGYWGLFPGDTTATVIEPAGGDLRSRHHFEGDLNHPNLWMPAVGAYPGDTVYNWFGDADAHRVVRSSNYHNIEANLLGFGIGGAARSFYLPTAGTMFSGTHGGLGSGVGGCGYCGGAGCGACGSQGCGDACGPSCNSCSPRFATGPCCLTPGCGSRCNITWLAGLRYFRFTDSLSYAASRNGTVFNGGPDDIYYDNQVTNDLIGSQLGGICNFCCGRRATAYALTKMGVFGNHAQYNSAIYGQNANAFINGGPFNGQDYSIASSKNNVAFLGEIGTGMFYRISSKWSANIGYRAIVASGVGTAVGTIPIRMNKPNEVADFNNNSTLILHGLSLGGVYNF